MINECRVYDPKGNLKWVHSSKELMKRSDDEFKALNTRLSNPRSIKPKAPRTIKCHICGKQFPYAQTTAKYCSDECKKVQRAMCGKKMEEMKKAGTYNPKRRGADIERQYSEKRL